MKIQHVSYEQRIRDLALSFPETYEDAPWGHPVFKVGDNKMFAAMSDGDVSVTLTVKLTPEEREIALHFPHVSVARYVGRTDGSPRRSPTRKHSKVRWNGCERVTGSRRRAKLRSAVEET
jgi:hypothetical protein